MGRWKRFGSKPTKSLAELKLEVNKLKEAEKNTEAYQELQREKEKIQKEIKKEGFQIRHRKALNILKRADSIAESIYKKSKPYVKKGLKELKKPM